MMRNAERPITALVEAYAELYPDEVARGLEARRPGEIASFLAQQSLPAAVAIFRRLLPDVAAATLDAIDDDTFRTLIPALEPANAAELLARLGQERLASRLALLDPDRLPRRQCRRHHGSTSRRVASRFDRQGSRHAAAQDAG